VIVFNKIPIALRTLTRGTGCCAQWRDSLVPLYQLALITVTQTGGNPSPFAICDTHLTCVLTGYELQFYVFWIVSARSFALGSLYNYKVVCRVDPWIFGLLVRSKSVLFRSVSVPRAIVDRQVGPTSPKDPVLTKICTSVTPRFAARLHSFIHL
jgi:hypothetical protein